MHGGVVCALVVEGRILVLIWWVSSEGSGVEDL